MTTTKLTVGYLHVGRPQHGVSRYGRLLAAEAQRRPELRVREAVVTLDGSRAENHARLGRAAEALAGADVVHLQYNNQLTKSVWGPGWSQMDNLRTFIRYSPAPLAISLHDVYPPTSWAFIRKLAGNKLKSLTRRGFQRLLHTRGMATTQPSFSLRSEVRRNLRPDAVTLGWVCRHRRLLVCTQEERGRLIGFIPSAAVTVIPHFVEERRLPLGPDDARRVLGLAGTRVVTLLGYVHPRKGHALLVEAMKDLPDNVHVVVAGGAERDHAGYLESLWDSARASGVAHRLRVTGYLPEFELDRYLAATDVAVCPFTRLSASCSVSTWLSAGCPIVAFDLPQIAEYNRLEAGAIETFSPYAPPALAAAILRLLESGAGNQLRAISRLRDRLHIARIMDAHLDVYRQLRPTACQVYAAGP
jgi:glycosyltransferase involved in cell wall biosynthesis